MRPRQPFLDWVASLDDSGILPNVTGEQTVYLIPEWNDESDAEAIIDEFFADLFQNSLLAWHTEGVRLAHFASGLQSNSIVENLCDYEIFDED